MQLGMKAGESIENQIERMKMQYLSYYPNAVKGGATAATNAGEKEEM